MKRIDAQMFDEVEDATSAIAVTVLDRHCKAAEPRDPERCALVLAAKEQGEFDKFVVHRTIAYGRRGGQPWLRFQSTPTTRKFVEQFDVGSYSAVPSGGLTFTFNPPRKAVSLSRLRSPKFKAKRNKSARDRKEQPRRPYRLPDPKTLAGVRNRFGHYGGGK